LTGKLYEKLTVDSRAAFLRIRGDDASMARSTEGIWINMRNGMELSTSPRQTGSFLAGRCFTIIAAVAVICIGLPSQRATAGPPFITDDPEPVETGHGELYLSTIDNWARDGVSGTLPHVEFNYGSIENMQLHVLAPMAYDRPNVADNLKYGYGDTEFGIKYRFIQEDQLFPGCPQVGTFPLVEFPTGDRNNGTGTGRAQFFLPVWMQKSWGEENRQWTVYGGGGYWFNPGAGNLNYGFVGVVLQKQLTDKLAVGGELNHSTVSARGQKDHTGLNLGCIYDFTEHWHALLSVGRDIHGSELLTSYAGIQLTF